MIPARLIVPVITLLISLILLVIAGHVPLTKEYRLLAPNHLTLASYLLQPGHTIQQTYLASGDKQSGIRIFTATSVITDQALSVSITNAAGRPLATGYLTSQAYLAADDTVVQDYSFPWFTASPNEPLTVTLSLASGSQLPLHVSTRNAYHDGDLYLDQARQPGDLALATIHPGLFSTEALVGTITGLIFVLAVSLIISFLAPPHQWWAAAALLVLITPLSLLGFWFSTGDLGLSDWDLYFSYHEVIRRTILDYHVFPFWNPWLCGGTAALGDPEFPLFTLTFLLELIFGIPTGFPLAIYLSIATTAVGLLLLAKRLHFSLLAALLAALAGTFGSVSLLEIVEGHPNVFAAMWIPWIFWAWYNAYASNQPHQAPNPKQIKNRKNTKHKHITTLIFRIFDLFRISSFGFRIWPLTCGLFLALTFYAGGIYLLLYTTLALFFITFLVRRPHAAIATTITAGLWGIGLAALKLLPVLSWLTHFQDKSYASSALTLPSLTEIFFGRHLHGANIIFDQGSGWHEYGAYIGYFVFALALIGVSHLTRHRLVRALVIAAAAAILLSSAGPALQPYFDHLPFLPRSNISRFILFAVIPLALLAGYGLDTLLAALQSVARRSTPNLHQRPNPPDRLEQAAKRPLNNPLSQRKLTTTIALLLLAFVAIDLFSLSSQLSAQAFVLPNVIDPPAPAPYPIAYTTQKFDQSGDTSRTTRSYAAILQGYGTLTYCAVLGPDPMVRTIHDQADNGLLLAQPEPQSVTLLNWHPNQAVFFVQNSAPTKLVLNANFASGWRAQSTAGGTTSPLSVFEESGRVAANLPPGEQTVTFQYHASGFIPGLVITITTLVLAFAQVYSKIKHHRP